MPGRLTCDAILLAGTAGDDKQLFPLTGTGAGGVKPLIPVANRPLLSYPLRTLADAGIKHAFVVVSGDRAAASVSAWLEKDHGANTAGVHCEVVVTPEGSGTADALRIMSSKVTAATVVVMAGDLLTDVPLAGLVASHQLSGALATVLLHKRRVSPASETKLGKAPKNVDYIGLDSSREHLLFYASSPDTLKDLKVSMSALKKFGVMTIHSDLTDAHLYIFNREVLGMVSGKATLNSVRQDLLPWLTQQQLRTQSPAKLDGAASMAEADKDASAGAEGVAGSEAGSEAPFSQNEPLPGADYMALSHGGNPTESSSAPGGEPASRLHVHIVPSTSYCARVSDVASFCEVNREVADSTTALHLCGLRPGKHDNIVPASTVLGNKATIAAGCLLGDGCVLGDKTSIKRSVLGNNVKLGANVKVINSILLDGAVVGDNCHVQNSILCPTSQLMDKVTIKDCQVGPGYAVVSGTDASNEVLARLRPPA